MIKDILKALLLSHAAPVVAFLFAALTVGYGAYRLDRAHQRRIGYDRGYEVARDSAREATILRLKAQEDVYSKRADSIHVATIRTDSALFLAHSRFANIERHQPRIEALPRPVPVDTADLVGVSVESTGEHFILPRAAARYWYVSDSLVAVAQQLLARYSAANKQWAEAWRSEHDARVASDSLVALLQSRQVQPAHPSRTRRVVSALAFVAVGFIAAKRVH